MRTELYFALRRKEVLGEIKRNATEAIFRHFLSDLSKGRITLAPIGLDVSSAAQGIARKCYARKEPIWIRTLDGIHLATAILLKWGQVITTDARLREAARVMGVKIQPPNSGPNGMILAISRPTRLLSHRMGEGKVVRHLRISAIFPI